MNRALLNFFIDLATFLVLLAMIGTGLLVRFVLPPGTGERLSVWSYSRHDWGDVHFWLAVGLGALVLVHLLLHWNWVCSVVGRWVRSSRAAVRPRSALRRNLVGSAVLLGTAVLVGGFVWVAQRAVVASERGGGFRGGRATAVELGQPRESTPQSPHAETRARPSLRGSMTLREAAELLNITPGRAVQIMGCENDVSPDEQLGRIARQMGLPFSTLRARLEAADGCIGGDDQQSGKRHE